MVVAHLNSIAYISPDQMVSVCSNAYIKKEAVGREKFSKCTIILGRSKAHGAVDSLRSSR